MRGNVANVASSQLHAEELSPKALEAQEVVLVHEPQKNW